MRYFLSGLIAWLACGPVQADACADQHVVVARLAAIYGETPRLSGAGPDDTRIDLFVAPMTGSWTIAVTHPDGRSCLVAAGQAFAWDSVWQGALAATA